jgi:hypothetical protein
LTGAKICWAITLFMSCCSALFAFVTIGGANGAPQEAAGAAMAMVVIPYVFTRCVEGISKDYPMPVEVVRSKKWRRQRPDKRVARSPTRLPDYSPLPMTR